MRLSFGHIFGLIVAAAMTAAVYFGWDWVGQITKKTVFFEYRLLILVVAAFLILSVLQWLWDKVSPPAD